MDRKSLRSTALPYSNKHPTTPHDLVPELLAPTIHGVVTHAEVEWWEESYLLAVRRAYHSRPRLSRDERITLHETTASSVFLRPNHANLTTATNIQMAHASP